MNKIYALLHVPTQQLVTFTTSSNVADDGTCDFANETCENLGLNDDKIWTTTNKNRADVLASEEPRWYNGWNHSFKKGELKVVEISIQVEK